MTDTQLELQAWWLVPRWYNMDVELTNTDNELENVAIANALQLETARHRAVPIRFNFTARQVWSRSAYPLPSYSIFTVDTLCYAVTLNGDWVALTFDLDNL